MDSANTLNVKICGITNAADAQCAINSGADWIGVIFAERSKRRMTVASAAEVLGQVSGVATVGGRGTKVVGVFQNQPVEEVIAVAHELKLHAVQLHGAESTVYANQVLAAVPTLGLLRAVGYQDIQTLSAAMTWWQGLEHRERFWGFLMDGPWGGGEGRVFDWSDLAESLKLSDYRAVADRLILAGGLTAENVAEAIRRVRPKGVDVATGVEARPGVKDHEAVRRFIVAAREASKG